MSNGNNFQEVNPETSQPLNNAEPSNSSLNGLYTSSSNVDVPQHFYIVSDRERYGKDAPNLVISEIYYSDQVDPGSSNSTIASLAPGSIPQSVMYNSGSILPSDYALIPSCSDQNLASSSSVNHFNFSNMFHPSETDSEVALTLASLGEPKNDKIDHFNQESILNNINDNSGKDSNVFIKQSVAQGDQEITKNRDDSFYSHAQEYKNVTEAESSKQQIESRSSTLVLRSRKGRGNNVPTSQYNNFPDPEKIGRKKRKKNVKTKDRNFKDLDVTAYIEAEKEYTDATMGPSVLSNELEPTDSHHSYSQKPPLVSETICQTELEFSSKMPSNILSDVCSGIFDKSLVLHDIVIPEEGIRTDVDLPDNVINYSDVTTDMCSETSDANQLIDHTVLNKSIENSCRNMYNSSNYLSNKSHNLNSLSVIASNISLAESELNPTSSSGYVHVVNNCDETGKVYISDHNNSCDNLDHSTEIQISESGVLCSPSSLMSPANRNFNSSELNQSSHNSSVLNPHTYESTINEDEKQLQHNVPTSSNKIVYNLNKNVLNHSVPSDILATPLQFNAEKENLLGQLLKASEHCEPASLIPAGVVDDVIPAVGYRIVEVSNLCEMIRSMHNCNTNNQPAIAIQEQASLREGAVSHLSVICTTCQVGTVCSTSNRAPLSPTDGGKNGLQREGNWDINMRVRQLVREFNLSEQQIQRMLEILGIFYRPYTGASNPVEGGNSRLDFIEVHSDAMKHHNGEQWTERDSAKINNVMEKNIREKMESSKKLSPPSPPNNNKKKKINNSNKSSLSVPKERKLSCNKCDAKFVSLNHLKKHAQSHNNSNHTCPYCMAYFKKPYNLKEHVKKHENHKYQCDLCLREFTDRSSLISHRKSAHEMRHNYQCPECQKLFFHRSHFKDHMRLHTRETPFPCEICGRRFIWRDSLRKHLETHIAEAKYSCRLCGKWFRWLQSVRQHLQQQHKLKKCDVEAQVRKTNTSQTLPKSKDVIDGKCRNGLGSFSTEGATAMKSEDIAMDVEESSHYIMDGSDIQYTEAHYTENKEGIGEEAGFGMGKEVLVGEEHREVNGEEGMYTLHTETNDGVT